MVNLLKNDSGKTIYTIEDNMLIGFTDNTDDANLYLNYAHPGYPVLIRFLTEAERNGAPVPELVKSLPSPKENIRFVLKVIVITIAIVTLIMYFLDCGCK